MRRINSVGGMNKSHRLSHGAKKVTPPSIPSFNHRGSGSSFGSDYSYEREDSTFSRDPSGGNGNVPLQRSNLPKDTINKHSSDTLTGDIDKEKQLFVVDKYTMEDQGIDMTLSPGRDSPGDDSSASIGTVESSSVSSNGAGIAVHGGVASNGGCRNSTTSLDSGRASNSNSTTTNSNEGTANNSHVSTFHTIQPIYEHRAMVSVHPPQPSQLSNRFHSHNGHSMDAGHGANYHNQASSFRQSYHSSTSSLGSADRAGEDTICALNIPEMVANGVPDHEILLAWLTDLHYEEYYELFISAGYDMPTISRMTPEDLTAIGIKKPNHRKRLKSEITKLNVPDGLPSFTPNTLEEWLRCIRLGEYTNQLRNQGYFTVDDVVQISIEDLEDVGLYKLGHQKRLLLAIKRVKELKSGRRMAQFHPPPGSLHVTASPLPSRSSLSHGQMAATLPYSSFEQQNQQSKHLQNLAKQVIPPQVPHPRQSLAALQQTTSMIDNSNNYSSLQSQPNSLLHNQASSVPQVQPNMYPQTHKIASSKPLYQPEVIRIDCTSASTLPAAPSPLLSGRPHLVSATMATPSPPPPPPPLRQASCLTEPDGGSPPPPPSPPSMPRPMAPLLSSYSRFQQQQDQQLLPQDLGFQTNFPKQTQPVLSPEQQYSQNLVTNRPWGINSMARSFDDGDIIQNYNSNFHRGEYFAQQTGAGIVRIPIGVAINNSGGGTLPRPKGLVKPRPVAKIAANPQPPMQQKQSTSNMSDLHQTDLCKNNLSSFVAPTGQLSYAETTSENNYGSQNNVGCYDQGETFANDNVGTIRMRSNSHVQQTFPDVNSAALNTAVSIDNEKLVQFDPSTKINIEGTTSDSSSQQPIKRMVAGPSSNGQRSAGDVLNDIGSMLSDLTDELDAMLHMERDPNKQ